MPNKFTDTRDLLADTHVNADTLKKTGAVSTDMTNVLIHIGTMSTFQLATNSFQTLEVYCRIYLIRGRNTIFH